MRVFPFTKCKMACASSLNYKNEKKCDIPMPYPPTYCPYLAYSANCRTFNWYVNQLCTQFMSTKKKNTHLWIKERNFYLKSNMQNSWPKIRQRKSHFAAPKPIFIWNKLIRKASYWYFILNLQLACIRCYHFAGFVVFSAASGDLHNLIRHCFAQFDMFTKIFYSKTTYFFFSHRYWYVVVIIRRLN